MKKMGEEMITELRTCMNSHKLSGQYVAGKLGVNPGTVSRWLTGKQNLSGKRTDSVRDFVGRLDWRGTAYAVVKPVGIREKPKVSKKLEPDYNQAEHFLELLGEGEEKFTFQTFDDSPEKRRDLARVLHGPLEENWPFLVVMNRRGAGIFITINETDLKGRKKENITRIRALWQEDDDKGGTELPLEPHVVVESSPGKYHRYILTDSPALEEFDQVQQVLVDQYGSDPNAKDISRVLRLPGFFHMKNPAKPTRVNIVQESGALPTSWDELKTTFPPRQKTESSDRGPDFKPTDIPLHVKSILTAENYNGSLCSLSSSFAANGMRHNGIVGVLNGIMDACQDKNDRWQARRNHLPVQAATAIAKYAFKDMQNGEWPDPEPVKAELEPVPPFTENLLPESIREWVMDVAGRMCVPPDYVAVALVVIVSSIIGTSCRIKPKRFDDWTVVPNLWGAACGYPSDGKTPSFEDVLTNSVSRLEQEASTNFANSMKEFTVEEIVEKEMRKIKEKALKEALAQKKEIDSAKDDLMELKDGDQPKKRRYRTNNASVEKIGEILRDNSRGILVYRDELVGAFNKWDENGDRPFYLESWSGKSSYIDDKIGRGTTEVPKVCLSILGTIQPDRITSYLTGAINGHDNDGFVQRFQLLIFPDRIKWGYVDRKPNVAARERTFNIIHSLAHADYSELCGDNDYALFSFDDEAQDLFIEWFTNLHKDKISSTDDHPVLVEHFGKYRSLMPSLALIFHLLDASIWVVDTPVDGLPSYRYPKATNTVSVSYVSRAIAWCEFLEAHARRIYGMATSAGVRAAAILAEKIKRGKLDNGFSRRTISRKGWKMLSDYRIIDDAIEILIDKNWIREVVPSVVNRKGGPIPLPCYEINEKVFSLCA